MNPAEQPAPPASLFRSFWMAGFECSSHINSAGKRLDMTASVLHDVKAAEDYRAARELGLCTARDGLRWNLLDRSGRYDWSSWRPMMEAACAGGVEVIWDLCHYGWPDDLDIFSPDFVERFAAFSAAVASEQLRSTGVRGLYVPVNEISFFAWAATRDLIFPYAHGRDNDLKRQLVRAAIASVRAVRSADPAARFVYPEPLIHCVPPRRRPWVKRPARIQTESQYEAWDMIAGRAQPELGGEESCLDIVGLNFYSANQWEVPGGRKLHWDAGSNDPRWMPLSRMLAEVWTRYRRPMFIAETSHYGTGRAAWLDEVSRECALARERGVPLEGVCLYPILDRTDWEDPTHWHNSGLWDLGPAPQYERRLNREYADALSRAQATVGQHVGC